MAFFFRQAKQKPKKILISRTDRIGDFVLTLPVFEALKSHFKEIEITVLCQDLVSPLLNNNPFVDHIISIPKDFSEQNLIQEIKEYQFDSLLVLVNDPIILKLLPKLHSIPVRIGPTSKPKAFLHYTHPVVQKRSKSICNEAVYNLEILHVFPSIPTKANISPKIYIQEEDEQRLEQVLTKLEIPTDDLSRGVVIHAGMNGSALNWEEKNYQEVAQKFVDEGFAVFLTGIGKEEEERNQKFIQKIEVRNSGKIYNLANQLSLPNLVAFLKNVKLFIGPSTGPTHLANGVSTPLISFYPPIQVQSKTRWEPYLAYSVIFTPDVECGQKYKCKGESCKDFFCMNQIDPTEVFKEGLKLIKKP
ncbi:MAG: ADP-heptose:LPS heptosyltransferase [bacterium]|jgi:ADP-heptose:LPS heptosyltransferase